MSKKAILIIITLNFNFFNLCSQAKLYADLSKSVSIRSNNQYLGSGFYYNYDSTLYLITAAHVLFSQDNFGQLSKNIAFQTIELISYDHIQSNQSEIRLLIDMKKLDFKIKHKEKDICVIPIGRTISREKRLISILSDNVFSIKKGGILNGYSSTDVIDINMLEQGQDVRLIGYPTSLDQTKFGNKVYEFEFPLLQTGIVSGISLKLGNIIISGGVFYGNSGGAVLVKKDINFIKDNYLTMTSEYNLIGIVTQLIPFSMPLKDTLMKVNVSNSGYTVVIPIKYADEIIMTNNSFKKN